MVIVAFGSVLVSVAKPSQSLMGKGRLRQERVGAGQVDLAKYVEALGKARRTVAHPNVSQARAVEGLSSSRAGRGQDDVGAGRCCGVLHWQRRWL